MVIFYGGMVDHIFYGWLILLNIIEWTIQWWNGEAGKQSPGDFQGTMSLATGRIQVNDRHKSRNRPWEKYGSWVTTVTTKASRAFKSTRIGSLHLSPDLKLWPDEKGLDPLLRGGSIRAEFLGKFHVQSVNGGFTTFYPLVI